MTKLLEQAFAAVSHLPDIEQDAVAARLLEDIEGEAKWDETFAASSDALATMAQRAVSDFKAGRTSPQNDDDLDLTHD